MAPPKTRGGRTVHILQLLMVAEFALLRTGHSFLSNMCASRSLAPKLKLRMQSAAANFVLPATSELAFDSSYLGADGKPRGFSNWLLPGSVMVGRYPHGTPFGSKTGRPGADESRAHIRKVLEAGVTTFVCLQEEVPPQDSDSEWNGSNLVALADAEMRAKYPQGFQRYFMDAEDIASSMNCGDLTYVHLPIKDFGTPSVSAMSATLDELVSEVSDGRGVYIHCWGGRGRAGTVGACLLLKLLGWEGVSAEEAAERTLATVQAGYDSRIGEDGGGSLSPETAEQREFVAAFAAAELA